MTNTSKIAIYVAAAVGFLFTTQSYAADHLMVVNEVLLSDDGDTDIQYVELADPVAESFPANPYTLGVYDDKGVSLGTVSLTVAPGTQRYLISTAQADSAFGTGGMRCSMCNCLKMVKRALSRMAELSTVWPGDV